MQISMQRGSIKYRLGLLLSVCFFIGGVSLVNRHLMLGGFFGAIICVTGLVKRKTLFGTCFMISFFTFLCGRYLVNWIQAKETLLEGAYVRNVINDQKVIPSLVLMFVACCSFLFGASIPQISLGKRRIKEKTRYINNKSLEYACILMFYATFVMRLLVSLERAVFVQSNGYTEYYVSFALRLPSFVYKIADLNAIAFFSVLAFQPRKKRTMSVLILNLINAGVLMIAGQRNYIVRAVLVSICYVVIRERGSNEEGWISKGQFWTLLLCVPIGVVLLQVWGALRVGLEFQIDTIGNVFLDFFRDQGSTSAVVYYGLEYAESFPVGRNYTFAPIINFFTNNVIGRALFKTEMFASQTEALALYGNNFGATLTYLHMPANYLVGIGMGSSYISEVFHDYGYLGVILISCMYAYVLRLLEVRMMMHNRASVWEKMILLMFMDGIIYSPRDSALKFITNGLNFSVLLYICLTIILSKIIKRKKM